MKISIFGTGYVGLVTGACLARLGHDVICCDTNKEKIKKLSEGQVPFFEPRLEKLVEENFSAGRINFTNIFSENVFDVDFIFIAVGTPSGENGEVDLSYVKRVAEDIGRNLKHFVVIVNKSTVPVGTGKMVRQIIGEYYKGDFEVVSNPEFLREGNAIEDFMKPERIVVGTDSERAKSILKELYSEFSCPLVSVSIETAEMIKYASNAFLATKVSFINEIANVCERVGADVEDVSYAMGLDSRIGNKFLKAGIGYGGSCFPKDVRGLKNIAIEHDYDFQLLKSIIKVNSEQKAVVVEKSKKLVGDLSGKRVCIWGLSFKPDTDDFRESLAVDIIKLFHKEKTQVNAYDPAANYDRIRETADFAGAVEFFSDQYEALQDCDVLVIATEWNEFKKADLGKIKVSLSEPNVVDGRNIYDPALMSEAGLNYLSIGR
ncbi:MAG: UDP-glucose/GDP-mannose dehydrogenase family protein [Candidatus Pacebacteria bacterium]|nr:UDP-glucose/GDP-mannose dehydrogenase family protein [Candidatus Paceibacterota bacterium]